MLFRSNDIPPESRDTWAFTVHVPSLKLAYVSLDVAIEEPFNAFVAIPPAIFPKEQWEQAVDYVAVNVLDLGSDGLPGSSGDSDQPIVCEFVSPAAVLRVDSAPDGVKSIPEHVGADGKSKMLVRTGHLLRSRMRFT